ncbi:hypothetical protein BDY19DRAFT_195320 [Irpex rosettiformis]|uniref:Uncharacterized protein n=1 Tax=Irpex rosettiformis TaxID=378272 RepID=A0ACB8U2H9_9APHY|nr:hypothetical protein BDY19DRAFT_195320 [Irpex rosettiformis]
MLKQSINADVVGLPSYQSVVNEGHDDSEGHTLTGAESGPSTSQSLNTPLLVIWEEQRVVIRRQPDYAAAITAIRKARTMEALRTESFYLKAVIPGCGDELCEVSEDMWADLVSALQSVMVVLDTRPSKSAENPINTSLKWARVPPAEISTSLPPARSPTLPTPPLSPNVDYVNSVPRNIGPYVILKPLTGQHQFQSVHSRDITVWELKSLVQASQGIPTERQRLVHAGKQLDDRQTLRQAGVPLGSTIDLRRVGLRGDMQSPLVT